MTHAVPNSDQTRVNFTIALYEVRAFATVLLSSGRPRHDRIATRHRINCRELVCAECLPVSSLISCCLVMVLRAGLALRSVRERPDTLRTRDALPMSAQEMPPPIALYRMITGFYVSKAIYVTARLGIADFLTDGPMDTEELAQASKTHGQSLKRVLRLLITAGLFT